MTRPPFKVDGRHGRLRWVDASGRRQAKAGRLTFLYGTIFAEAVLAGTGRDFEISLNKDVWHRIDATTDEVKDTLRGSLGATTRIKRCETIRAARLRRGLPVV